MSIDTNQAYAVPLRELLRHVPKDHRLWIEYEDATGHRHIPVGRLCHDAADEIDRLRERITKAEEAMMFSSCGFCRDATRHLQGLCVPELED